MVPPSASATNTDWKWSLKELMSATLLLAVFVAIASYLGFGHPLLWVCTIASAILAVVCATSIPFKRHVSPRVVSILIMLVLCNPIFMFFSLVMTINSVSHLLFNSIASRFQTPLTVRRVLAVSITLTLVSFSIGVLVSLPDYFKVESAKERYRPIDLHNRLSYENQNTVQKTKLSVDAPSAMETYFIHGSQDSNRFMGRAWELKSLHDGRLDSFVRSSGFGVGRFFGPSLNRIEFPEPQDLPFTALAEHEYQSIKRRSLRGLRYLLPNVNTHETLHASSLLAFVSPASTGLLVEPKVSAGFQAHAMRLPPQNFAKTFLEKQGLTLKSLQLVSLQRFDAPRAYVLDHLPRMDQLTGKDVPTRKLSHFESSAIQTLQQNPTEDIITEVTDDGLAMVGSVRAYESCLECHSGQRGRLLGAFTYTFVENTDQNHGLGSN